MEKTDLPGFKISALTFGSIVIVISVGLFYLKINLQSLLLICLIIAGISAWRLTRKGFKPIREAMDHGVKRALSAIYIFMLIGVLVASFIQSGTVGTLIYYGLKFMSPGIFLPAGLILCSLMSLATGSSWGTAGTAGIILIGMGNAIGIPPAITAGMVVSGACFGDKISPVSDTTNLAAMASGVPLYEHMKSMIYTTFPSYIIALIIFSIIGINYSDKSMQPDQINQMINGLTKSYDISVINLLPLAIMLTFSIIRVSAEPSMVIASLSAVILAFFKQGYPFDVIMRSLLEGHAPGTGVASLNKLLSGGGILSMMPALSITLLTLTLGGILQRFGFVYVLIETILKRIKHVSTLVTSTIIACIMGNITMGEAYMSIILCGRLFNETYKKQNIDGSVLSRSLEEGATLTTTLIPWATGGLFFAATLKVPVVDYAPWAFFNWINPVVSIIFAFFGIAIWKTKQRENDKEHGSDQKTKLSSVSYHTVTMGEPSQAADFSLNNTDSLAIIRNFPVHLRENIHALLINNHGSTPEAFMVTENFIGYVSPNKYYCLTEEGLTETTKTVLPALPGSVQPNATILQGKWSAATNTIPDKGCQPGSNGYYYLKENIDKITIPVEKTTEEHLSFYNCRFIMPGAHILFETEVDLAVNTIHIGDDYEKHYLLNKHYGKGVCIKTCAYPHFYMPLSPDAAGYLIIGRQQDESSQYVLSAFKLPARHGVYIPLGVPYSVDHFTGQYLSVCAVKKDPATFIKKNNGEIAPIVFS